MARKTWSYAATCPYTRRVTRYRLTWVWNGKDAWALTTEVLS